MTFGVVRWICRGFFERVGECGKLPENLGRFLIEEPRKILQDPPDDFKVLEKYLKTKPRCLLKWMDGWKSLENLEKVARIRKNPQ